MKKTFDFDFRTGEFKMKNKNPVELEGVDALKLWIEKCIRTQLDRYSIYKGKRYGANIEDLVIGKSYGSGFVESELRREIEEALLRHEDILSLSSFSITTKRKLMEITFSLATTYGELSEVYVYDS